MESHDITVGELYDQFVAPTYGRFPIHPKRGKGVDLWDENGKHYLDFAAGVAVNSLGHAHPALIEVFENQPADLLHCSNLYQPRGQGELARMLSRQVVKAPGKCFFTNSGTEANEGLIKLARRFGEAVPSPSGKPRREIISFLGSFHGRSTGSMAVTGQEKVRTGFGPLMEGFVHLPFNDIEAFERGLTDGSVAVFLEVVQGEGGIHVATPEFLRAVAAICRERDMLLFFDEVQCGMGRCGDLAGWRCVSGSTEIVPDGVSWAKGLGAGFPIGAIWFRDRPAGERSLCELLGPGSHGATYGGSPLACEIAKVVIERIVTDNLLSNASELGQSILNEAERRQLPMVSGVRGLGLMIGFQLDVDRLEKSAVLKDDGRVASVAVVDALGEAGLLTVPAGGDVVRWLPPLVACQEDVDKAFGIMEKVLNDLMK
ncbi:MAG: aminotransferase class III-fold pyridoxal phosphate-dependent enzyme [Verrucomicrobiota bacterium]|nr:aminotransferase class III-fold pyridoxal phosphate-dependent enzyme [Verrucomicrobiota bacterium]